MEQRFTKCIKPNDIPWEGNAARNQRNYKHTVYSPLLAIAKKQFQDGRRAQEPVFLAAVATTYGEVGHEFVKLQEFLCTAYGRHIAGQGCRDDGSTIQDCTTLFRQKFRQRVIMAVAKGQAHMLNQCGLPRQCCKSSMPERAMPN